MFYRDTASGAFQEWISQSQFSYHPLMMEKGFSEIFGHKICVLLISFKLYLMNMPYHFYFINVNREEEGRKKIKSLQKQIQNVRVEREEEIQQRNQMIAHLKDQLQEMKAKTSMEGKYIQKDAEVAVGQTQKRCMLSEKDAKEEIEVSRVNYSQRNCKKRIKTDFKRLLVSCDIQGKKYNLYIFLGVYIHPEGCRGCCEMDSEEMQTFHLKFCTPYCNESSHFKFHSS